MISDGAHGDQPGENNWNQCHVGDIGVNPLHGAEPEEADKHH